MTAIGATRLQQLRTQARTRLLELPTVPSPSMIEWTAVVLAENELAQAAPSVQAAPSAQALREQGWLSSRAAAAGLLSPGLAAVLQQVDPQVLMPREEVQGTNRMRLVGRGLDCLTLANRAAGLEDRSQHGFALLGLRTAEEKQALERGIDRLVSVLGLDRLRKVADRFQAATALGQVGDKNVAGLAGGRTVALERSLLAEPARLQVKLDHEVGHLLDQSLAAPGQQWRSHGADTPFGKPGPAGGFVSEYARHNAHEDFAETHALLLSRWEAIAADPTLELFALGPVGEKLAWILENGYGRGPGEVPPAVRQTLELVNQGQSPFGWRDDQGELQGALESYLAEVGAWQRDPLGFLDPNHPRREQRQWLVEALREGHPRACPAASEAAAFESLMTTRRLEHDPAQNWTLIGAGQEQARDSLHAALAQGGEGLYQALKSRLGGLESASEQDRMGYRLERAWAGVRTSGAAPSRAAGWLD